MKWRLVGHIPTVVAPNLNKQCPLLFLSCYCRSVLWSIRYARQIVAMFLVAGWAFATHGEETRGADAEHGSSPASMSSQETLPSADCVRLHRRARIAWQQDRKEDAVAELEQAGEVCPESVGAALVRLELRRLMNDQAGVERDLKSLRALLLQPDQGVPVGVFSRAILDPSATEDELLLIRDRLAERRSRKRGDPDLLATMAVVEARLGRPEESRVLLGELLDARGSPDVRWTVVRFDVALGRPEDAIVNLEILAGEDSEFSSWAQFELFSVYGELGRMDDVVRLADVMLGDGASRQAMIVEGMLCAAWSLIDRDDFDSAKKLFGRVARIDPLNEEAIETLRVLFGSAEERAAHREDENRRLDGEGDPEVFFEEGTNRLAAGDAAGALPLLLRAAEGLSTQPVAWYNLGMAAIKVEDWNVACRALARADELEPGKPDTEINLGIALSKAGRCEESVTVLEHAVKDDPSRYRAQYYLYSCYSALGDVERAATALERYNQGRSGS